jgi:hypothetical protein
MFRKTWSLMVGLLAVVVVGCSGPLPTAPAAPASTVVATPPPSQLLGLPSLSCLLGDVLNVLGIGPNGGTLTVGGNSLVVPKGALSGIVNIVMKSDPGNTVAVDFFPEGLVFSPNALPTLTLNTDCIGNPPNAYIVYTDAAGNVLERLPTTHRDRHTVSAQIHHFSRYAVAW